MVGRETKEVSPQLLQLIVLKQLSGHNEERAIPTDTSSFAELRKLKVRKAKATKVWEVEYQRGEGYRNGESSADLK